MLKYLIPQIALADLRPMVVVAVAGALIAGAYGIVHDQVTYTISPEYFTKLKFKQFHYADFGLGDRIFVATIGFLATWWVGFIAAWFLARRLVPNQSRADALRQIRTGFLCVFAFGFGSALMAYGYGLWRGPDADYSWWMWAIQQYEIKDHWAFVRVAYIHNASYCGGLIGLIVALLMLRPNRREQTTRPVIGTEPEDARERQLPPPR